MYTNNQTRAGMHLPQLLVVIFMMAVLLPAMNAFAQNQPVYVGVNFIKVHPGKHEQYRQLTSKYGNKINEYFFKKENLLGWYLYQVLIPSGSSAEFDYAAVNVTGNLSALLDFPMSAKDIYKKVFPEMTDKMVSDVLAQYDECRHVVSREIYMPVQGAHTQDSSNAPPAKYLEVDQMHPAAGKTADYIKMEKDIYLPLHKERIKMGMLKSWGLYEKVLPVDTRSEFEYVTVNFFDDLNKLGEGYADAIKKVFPQKDMTTLWNETMAARTMVRSGIWKLVMYVDGSNTKK